MSAVKTFGPYTVSYRPRSKPGELRDLETATVYLDVYPEDLVRLLGPSAALNRSGKSVEAGGGVVVRKARL